MMNYQEVEEYVLSMPDAWLDFPFGKDVAVYKVGDEMFALLNVGRDPVQISLKCDPLLSKVLREKYDEVMTGHHLNKKYWNTLVLSGQLDEEEIKGLIRHSYLLVTNKSVI
jgi:predicted DNA-binding protein (MmcQ/YjbR family)